MVFRRQPPHNPLWRWQLGRSFQLLAKVVAFAAGRLKVEGQVFHVEPQLAQSVLDEVEDAAAAAIAVDHSREERFEDLAMLARQGMDGIGQVEHFAWMSSLLTVVEVVLVGWLMVVSIKGVSARSEKHAACQTLP